MKKYIVGLLLFLILIPSTTYAAWEDYIPGGLMDFGGGDLPTLIARIIRLLLVFASVVAVIYLIIGGYQYITSAGNPENVTKGRTTVLNSVIGLIIIFASYLIVSYILIQLNI